MRHCCDDGDRDGVRGASHLLAERGDPPVPRVGDEHQCRRLEPAGGAGFQEDPRCEIGGRHLPETPGEEHHERPKGGGDDDGVDRGGPADPRDHDAADTQYGDEGQGDDRPL